MIIPGSYKDPATGMVIIPERLEENLADRVKLLELQVHQLQELVETLSKR